tara:strand:+ start:1465 stop:1638 length:174 start_codon:yes stop_codon:yes gene_type:complete
MSIKKVEIKLVVDVDTTDDFICPSGNPLEHNCVLNAIESDYFLEPVSVLEVKEQNHE